MKKLIQLEGRERTLVDKPMNSVNLNLAGQSSFNSKIKSNYNIINNVSKTDLMVKHHSTSQIDLRQEVFLK